MAAFYQAVNKRQRTGGSPQADPRLPTHAGPAPAPGTAARECPDAPSAAPDARRRAEFGPTRTALAPKGVAPAPPRERLRTRPPNVETVGWRCGRSPPQAHRGTPGAAH